jgi:WD40 repeat protein
LPDERFAQVIEGPADRAQVTLEPGLVHSMIADARTDDALPLLAFTLREMYERCRDRDRLTLNVYREELGGIRGAVARVVERIKSGRTWTPELARALRRAFLKFTRVNDEGQYIRQPCRWADLPDLAAPVLEAFVKARLLSSNGDVVEVTHESLFRVWPELACWLDDSRELMLWKKTIQDDLNDWLSHERSPLYLLSGARVIQGRHWLDMSADEFPGAEGEFITASIAAEDARIARERAQQEKLRWYARGLAAVAVTTSVLGVYSLIQRNEANVKAESAKRAEEKEKTQRVIAQAATQEAKDQTVLAQRATMEAKAQAKIARSRQLASLSRIELDKRIERSLLLAVEATQTADTLEARSSLFDALQARSGLRMLLHLEEGDPTGVAFTPDDKTLAVGFHIPCELGPSGIMLWDVVTGKRLIDKPLDVGTGFSPKVAFSPDGKTLAAGCWFAEERGGVWLWDVATHARVADGLLGLDEGQVLDMTFSPDGKALAARHELHLKFGDDVFHTSRVTLWDLATRKRFFEPQVAGINVVAFAPDGKTFAAAMNGLAVVLWDLATRKSLAELPFALNEGPVHTLAFSPDGKTIVAGCGSESGHGAVVFWDAATRTRLANEFLAVKEGRVTSLAFSLDGKTLAAGYVGPKGSSRGVVLWDRAARACRVEKPLALKEGSVSSIAFSSDGKSLLAEAGSPGAGEIALWNVATPTPVSEAPITLREGEISSWLFSPGGKFLALAYDARSDSTGADRWDPAGVALVDFAARKQPVDSRLLVTNDPPKSLAFSPDGKTLATSSYRGVVLWDAATRTTLAGDQPVLEMGRGIDSVAFSPDGKTLAGGYNDLVNVGNNEYDSRRGVLLWNVATRKRVGDEPLGVNGAEVNSVAFSPDGKTLAAGYGFSSKGGVALWDTASRQRQADGTLPVAEGEIKSVAFSPDGQILVAGYAGVRKANGVVMWDVAKRRRLTDPPLAVEEGKVLSVAFSPDSKTLAAATAYAAGVTLWDVAARKRLTENPLAVNEGEVQSVAFSPDGKTLVAAFDGPSKRSGGAVLWSVSTWKRLFDKPIAVDAEYCVTVAFSPTFAGKN